MPPSTMQALLQIRIRAAVRRCIAEEVERLVDMLDALDGDPDTEYRGDGEPFLGWTTTMTWGTTDDREVKVTTPV